MTAIVVIGILGLSAGVFGLLTLQAAGCNVTVGSSLLDLLALQCPLL
jgi:hypothetical protein